MYIDKDKPEILPKRALIHVCNVGNSQMWEDAIYLCPYCFDYVSTEEMPVLTMIDAPTGEKSGQAWGLAHNRCINDAISGDQL